MRLDRWSRRNVLGSALGIAAGALLPLPASAQATPAARPPARGGRIRVASIASSTSDTLDPAKGGLSTDYVRHFMLYSGLTVYDGALTAQPALAETIETNDQIVWRIKLRSGVRFHDGSLLTGRDVVYSLMRHKDPASASKVRTIAEQFAEARDLGGGEVEIRLTGPNVDLPMILAQSHFLIVRDGGEGLKQGIGTGPFRLKAFQPGIRTVVVRNEDYWRDGRPYLDEIELIAIPDEVSRVNALLSGDVHLINAMNPRSTRRVLEAGTHSVMEVKSGLYTSLIARRSDFGDAHADVVMALKHLFDRDLIRRALFKNFGALGNDQPIQPGHPYFRDDLPQRVYDPDRARFHLKRAGLVGSRMAVYASPAAEGSVDMASVLQETGAPAGLNLAVNRVPSDGYWSSHWMKHPLTFGNTNPRPTADLVFSLFFKSTAPWNESGWSSPRFDELLVQARGEPDVGRRKQMYGEMQELVHNGCGLTIPVFIALIDGFDKRLKGLSPIPLGGFMGYTFAEHVWWEA